MFRVYAASVRSIYLLAVISSATLGVWLLLQSAWKFLRPDSTGTADRLDIVIIGLLLACVIPAARAIIRIGRRADLLPDAHLRERPVVASLVAFATVVGLLLVYLVLRAWLDIQPWGATDGGPIAGAAGLALLLVAFAMLTGEIVLVGRTEPLAR